MLKGNAEAIEAWNTILFDKFVKYRDVLVNGLAHHGNRAMELFPVQSGWSVVDIGCGFGDTTIELGRRVGPSGRAVGVDAAARFIDEGRKDAAAARTENVTFEVADVEEKVPGGPYDRAFSRMGTMFFAQPVFALRNTRKVLKPGGQLVMVVWRRKDANEGFYNAELAVREILGDPPKGDNVTCGPGPFSMSSPDLVSDQLGAAGFTNVTFARVDAPLKIGNSLDEAVEFALMLGPAGEVVRLAGQAAIDKGAEIRKAVRAIAEAWVAPSGEVWAPSSSWVISATA